MNQRVFLSIVGGVVAVGAVAVIALSVMRSGQNYDGRGSGMMERMNTRAEWQDRQSDSGLYTDRRPGMKQGAGQGRGIGMNANRGNCLADECLAVDGLDYPVETLPDSAKQALGDALDDEYRAWATYGAAIEKFGNIRPFIMIIRAEEQHISSLKGLFEKYGLTIPENTYVSRASVPATVAAACQIGVDAEIANAKLYQEKLLPAVTAYPDITQVFTNLMNASQEKHLPAFDRCN